MITLNKQHDLGMQMMNDAMIVQQSQIENLSGKLDVLTYCEQRTKDEVEYMNLMNYYSGNYGENTTIRPPHIRLY